MPWSRHIVVVLTVVNGLVAFQTLSTLPAQTEIGVSYPPFLRMITAGIWTVLFAGLTVGLFQRPVHVLHLVAPTLTVYGIWALLSLVAFARSDFDRGRTLFQAIFTLIALVPFWWWHVRVSLRAKPATNPR